MDLEAVFGLGPFTRKLALEAGMTAWQWRLIQPRLVRLGGGVFLLRKAEDARTRHCQRVAGLLLRKTDHFAYGMSAVALLGLPDPPFFKWDDQLPQIAGKKTRKARGVQRCTAVPFPTAWGDCTDAVTTAINIAATRTLPEALMVTDAVARLLADTEDRDELASADCRNRVRRLLTQDQNLPALALANPAAEAPSESFYRGQMILHGYTDPPCGVPKLDAAGKQRYVDILLENLAIEIDGDEKLQSVQDLRDEKEREDNLRLTGLAFLRPRVKLIYADPAQRMTELDRKVTEVRAMRRLAG